ncbi:hypothetical protein L7Q78_41315, partial [Achromobacter xylosoxidans]|nr:hypothetical protein [Achromobacter xylosoxidans]
KRAEVGQDFGPRPKPLLVQLASTQCAQPAALGVIHSPLLPNRVGQRHFYPEKTLVAYPGFRLFAGL